MGGRHEVLSDNEDLLVIWRELVRERGNPLSDMGQSVTLGVELPPAIEWPNLPDE